MDVKNQKFLILGVSKSGIAVAKYLLGRNSTCYLYDDSKSEKAKKNLFDLSQLGGEIVEKGQIERVLKEIDVLVISPGVAINHEIAVRAKEMKKRILGELEFGFLQFSPLTVAVTGTNGKTTTVSMIEWVLECVKEDVISVGNVGKPITSELENVKKGSVLVCETSSFQLESVNAFCPHIACVLNLSPDHLDRHYTMENYAFLKKRLLKNQTESEYAVLNYDDVSVRGFAEGVKSKIVWVSANCETRDGAYVDGEELCYKEERIMNKNELSIGGEHNIYNALFTIAVCKLLGVDNLAIKRALETFHGVKNRMELVAEKKGVKYYNDSKSTNTASTISAIKSGTNGAVIILGGSEKGEDYSNLFDFIKNSRVKHVVLTGESKINMLRCAISRGYDNFSVVGKFETAILVASSFAESGDSVILTPACASFDCFSCFEERGDRFREIVGGLPD